MKKTLTRIFTTLLTLSLVMIPSIPAFAYSPEDYDIVIDASKREPAEVFENESQLKFISGENPSKVYLMAYVSPAFESYWNQQQVFNLGTIFDSDMNFHGIELELNGLDTNPTTTLANGQVYQYVTWFPTGTVGWFGEEVGKEVFVSNLDKEYKEAYFNENSLFYLYDIKSDDVIYLVKYFGTDANSADMVEYLTDFIAGINGEVHTEAVNEEEAAQKEQDELAELLDALTQEQEVVITTETHPVEEEDVPIEPQTETQTENNGIKWKAIAGGGVLLLLVIVAIVFGFNNKGKTNGRY